MKYLKIWTNFLDLMQTLEYDEIGRLFEMMLVYAECGREPEMIDGNERFLWPVAKQQIDLTAERNEILRANGMKGGRPKTKDNQEEPKETKQNQEEPKESCKEKKRKEKERRIEEDDDNARAIQADHNRVLNAAEDAGFQRSNSVRAKLIDLYAVHGLEKVLAGIDSCVQHGATNLAYLEACMKDQPKPKAANGRGYDQRDYSAEQEAALQRMMESDWGETG